MSIVSVAIRVTIGQLVNQNAQRRADWSRESWIAFCDEGMNLFCQKLRSLLGLNTQFF